MKRLLALSAFLTWSLFASAQVTPIDVQFKLVAMKDNYDAEPAPLAGVSARLVLGDAAGWQEPDAGHRFVTDAKGEARFTVEAAPDARIRSRNIGFTPFSLPSRTEHLKIGIELEHRVIPEKGGPARTFRWLLTMDLDCFRNGECRTVGFTGIHTPDAQGRFTIALVREPSAEAWKVPALGGQVIRGMSYQAADFMLSANEQDPKRRTLSFAVKRLPL
jgi:hypothetical protein